MYIIFVQYIYLLCVIKPQLQMYANPDYNIFVWQHTFLEQSNCYLKSIWKSKKKKDENNNNPPPPKKTTSTQKTKQQQQLIANISFNPLQLSLNFSLMRH